MSQYPNRTSIALFETFCRKNQVDGKPIEIKIGEHQFNVKALTTPRSQAKGYSGEKVEPKDGEGLLFIYDKEGPLEFWMKEVPFDLDILFFDSNSELVDYQTMSRHQGEPDKILKRYRSKKPARFAVEVKSGWCEKNNIKDCKLSF